MYSTCTQRLSWSYAICKQPSIEINNMDFKQTIIETLIKYYTKYDLTDVDILN